MTPGRHIIGITGKAGAGKDTIAHRLCEKHGYAKVAFADPIRRGILAMFKINPMYFLPSFKEETLPNIGKSPRELMQTLGTEWGRNLVHPDLWMILAKEAILAHLALGRCVVITDVRFENEAAFVRELGGTVWHVDRPGAGTVHAHTSESGVNLLNSDMHIPNKGTLDQLFQSVDWMMA